MSEIMQIFTGNPMTTFVGKKIEAATRPELESEDWGLNMEICDIINENDDDAKDAARAIRKRLQQIEQDRNFTITNRTLTILETCVNNCSHRFHLLVMTKDFIQDLVKLIGPKNNPPIDLQERVLSLIESWAEAFRSQPDLSGVVSVYNELKTKGVTFPPRDPSSRVPIQTPQRTVPASMPAPPLPRPDGQTRPMPGGGGSIMAPAPNVAQGGQVMLEGEDYNKISQDLVVVQSSIEMFNDIMKTLEALSNAEADWELANELSVTCHQMKDRIVDLIERVANEELTIELLRLNDDLNTTFSRFENLCKNRSQRAPPRGAGGVGITESQPATDRARDVAQTRPPPTSTSGAGDQISPRTKLVGVSSNTLNELSLIDFNAARASETGQGGANQPTPAPPATKQSVSQQATRPAVADPFNTSNIAPVDKSQASLADELRGLNLGNSSGPRARPSQNESNKSNLPDEISSVREQDFAEIENWLSTDSGRNLASIGGDMPSMEPISVPNSEFDNFIASRALAGSNASGQQQQQQQPKPPSQQKPEPSV